MTPSRADIIYNKVLKEFKKLVKGKLKEVKITLYEMSQLDFNNVHIDKNGNIHKDKNYADILREICIKHNIIEIEDLANYNYIFKLGGNKDD